MSSFRATHDTNKKSKKKVKVGNFDKFVFPRLRRVYPSLVASNLVGVQSMTGSPAVRICCYDPEDYPALEKDRDVQSCKASAFFTKYKYKTKKIK